MIEQVVDQWHRYLRGDLPGGLEPLLDDDVVFYSPIVYSPQHGKAVTARYLQAAAQALPGDPAPGGGGRPEADGGSPLGDSSSFRYTKKVLSGDTAVLEFETTIEGTYVNCRRSTWSTGRWARPWSGCARPPEAPHGARVRRDRVGPTLIPWLTVSTPGSPSSPCSR